MSDRVRHPAVLFMLVACGYSWTLWGLMMASAQGWLPFHFPTNFLGSFGPSLAGLIMAAKNRGGARAVLKSILQWRFAGRWYAMALLGPPLLFVLVLALGVLFGQVLPAPQNLDKAAWVPLLFVVVLLLGGPLGEELGWRGYLLPKLLAKQGRLRASLWVAAAWFVWHLPLFWLEGAAQKGSSMLFFGVCVAAFSVLFTWIYIGSGGSLLAVLLAHTMVNLPSFCLSHVLPSAADSDLTNSLLAGLLVLAAAAVVVARWPWVDRGAPVASSTAGPPG